MAQSSEPTSRLVGVPWYCVRCRWLQLAAAGCRWLAAGRPPQMENEDYVVAAAAGAADTRGARSLRRDAVRHREWRTERIGALCHRVAVRASATESGAEEDEAGAAWKWNIDGGELFEECLRRAKLEGHLPDLMRGCPFSGQTALPDAEPAARADSSLRDTGTQRRLSRIRPEGSGGGAHRQSGRVLPQAMGSDGAGGKWPMAGRRAALVAYKGQPGRRGVRAASAGLAVHRVRGGGLPV